MISKKAINRAGDILRSYPADSICEDVIRDVNEWREAHILPMNACYDECMKLTDELGYQKDTIVAQRIKRMPTIVDKLKRFPDMKLSRMQDIGGVRAIFKDVRQLRDFYDHAKLLPSCKRVKDYIVAPKNDGYRGYHLVFDIDGLLIELQLRTQLQHLWATSVETIDMIRNTSLKTHGANDCWAKFFKLTSSAFAYMEELPLLPEDRGLDIGKLLDRIRTQMNDNAISDSLRAYAATGNIVDGHRMGDSGYYAVLSLDTGYNSARVSYFSRNDYRAAMSDYEFLEKAYPKNQNVLVTVNDLLRLRDIYPSYFKDITRFREIIEVMLAS